MSTTKRHLVTPTMRDALVRIVVATPQSVFPSGGGFWQVGENVVPWSTSTVYALEDRGLLRKVQNGLPKWKSQFELTGCGRMIAQALVDGRW